MENCVSFLSYSFCLEHFARVKYLASYARVEHRKAGRSSCKVDLFLLNLTESAALDKYYCNVLYLLYNLLY